MDVSEILSLLSTDYLWMHSNLFGHHSNLRSVHLPVSNYPCFVKTASQTHHKDSEMSNVVFRKNASWSFTEQVWSFVLTTSRFFTRLHVRHVL